MASTDPGSTPDPGCPNSRQQLRRDPHSDICQDGDKTAGKHPTVSQQDAFPVCPKAGCAVSPKRLLDLPITWAEMAQAQQEDPEVAQTDAVSWFTRGYCAGKSQHEINRKDTRWLFNKLRSSVSCGITMPNKGVGILGS